MRSAQNKRTLSPLSSIVAPVPLRYSPTDTHESIAPSGDQYYFPYGLSATSLPTSNESSKKPIWNSFRPPIATFTAGKPAPKSFMFPEQLFQSNVALRASTKCSHCGEHFKDINTLASHIEERHQAVKPFQCSECRKTFAHKSTLSMHLRVHAGQYPFHCSHCDKSFSRRSYLTRHLRSHSGEKPFECPLCQKCFSQKTNCTRHIGTHHNVRAFACTRCPRRFAKNASLKIHWKKKHCDEIFPPKSYTKSSLNPLWSPNLVSNSSPLIDTLLTSDESETNPPLPSTSSSWSCGPSARSPTSATRAVDISESAGSVACEIPIESPDSTKHQCNQMNSLFGGSMEKPMLSLPPFSPLFSSETLPTFSMCDPLLTMISQTETKYF